LRPAVIGRGLLLLAVGALIGAISFVQYALIPGWQALDPATLRASFRAVDPASAGLLLVLNAAALALGLVAVIGAWRSGRHRQAAIDGAGTALLAAMMLLSAFVTVPVNRGLAGVGSETAVEAVRRSIAAWAYLNAVRMALGVIAYAAFAAGFRSPRAELRSVPS
jgi:Anthrone oxygenase